MQLPTAEPSAHDDDDDEDQGPDISAYCNDPPSPGASMQIAVALRHPDERDAAEEEARWYQAHRKELKALRARGRSWTSDVFADDRQQTVAERMHIEHIERGAVPCTQVIRGLSSAGASPSSERRHRAIDSGSAPTPWRAKASPWLLFGHVPGQLPPQTRAALEHLVQRREAAAREGLAIASTCADRDAASRALVKARSAAALALALAIRAWEPDEFAAGVAFKYERSVRVADVPTERELRNAADNLDGLRVAKENLVSAVARLPDESKPTDDTWEALYQARERAKHSLRANLERKIQLLDRQIQNDEPWLDERKRRAALSERVIASAESGARQPDLEKSWLAARRRWWLPVEHELRSDPVAGWDEHRLAALILERAWFVDMVPRVRRRYGDEPTFAGLRALLRQTRTDRSRAAPKKRGRARPR